jgi:hypothetical protein
MRVTVVAACVVTVLASTAHAVPSPTRATATDPSAGYDRQTHAWLGSSLDQVSPSPIPTPVAEAFDDDFMDLLSVDSSGGMIETDRKFSWCANEGEGNPSCFCNGAVRFGSFGTKTSRLANLDVPKWAYRRNCGNVDCAAKDFGGVDPFPGEQKICQCTDPIPTPTPKPNSLGWKFCAREKGTCACEANSVVRYGSTGSADLYAGGAQPDFFKKHPEVTKWKYLETPLHVGGEYSCVDSTFPGAHPWPEALRKAGQQMLCQCAPLPKKSEARCEATPTPKPTFDRVTSARDNLIIGSSGEIVQPDAPRPWQVKWTWCAAEGDECNCLGVARYGHSGDVWMYGDNSKFFIEHPEIFKWTNKETDGAITCTTETFGGLDPFPGRRKMCQCASGVGIDVFVPFSVTVEDMEAGAKPVANIPVTPQVVLTVARNTSADLGGSEKAPVRRAYHHKMQPANTHLEARDLAGFAPAEVEALRRLDEVAAMKAATAAIAALEGVLPALPEELGLGSVAKPGRSIVGRFANLGAAAPGKLLHSLSGEGVALFGVAAAAAAFGVVASLRRIKRARDAHVPLLDGENASLASRSYPVYL